MAAVNLVSAFAVYFIIWWITLFTVLPWGIRSQIEEGEIANGTEPGAPATIKGWRIIMVTTFASLLVFFPLYFFWETIMAFLINISA